MILLVFYDILFLIIDFLIAWSERRAMDNSNTALLQGLFTLLNIGVFAALGYAIVSVVRKVNYLYKIAKEKESRS